MKEDNKVKTIAEQMRKNGITVDNLIDFLHAKNVILTEQMRLVKVEKGKHKAKLQKEKAAKTSSYTGLKNKSDIPVSAIELISSFDFDLADGSGKISDVLIAEVLAKSLEIEFIRIDPLNVDMDIVTQFISQAFAFKNMIIPLSIENDYLVVAAENPLKEEAFIDLQQATKKKIKKVMTPRSDLLMVINQLYGFSTSLKKAEKKYYSGHDISNLEQLVSLSTDKPLDAKDAPIINAVDHIFRYAYEQRASDIHIEPRRENSLIRFRIDGILHDIQYIPKVVHSAIVSRLKILSRMDLTEKRRPQDGRIKTKHQGKEIELRVSSVPVAFGEKIVMRIFDPEQLMIGLDQLGYFEFEYQLFEKVLEQKNGIILITGPTGSGKTTTLYSALNQLNSPDVNIMTIEDPIEIVHKGFNQIAVQPKIEITFSSAIRTILRQDPDIIMIGEIRDQETAQNAVQAALTGHLVFSTLHTNSSAGAITRLRDLGIQSFLIAETLRCVIAQRLVRKICPHCKAELEIGAAELESLKTPVDYEDKKVRVWTGAGCQDCRNTGYLGRTAVAEVLLIDQRLKKLIYDQRPAQLVEKKAIENSDLRLLRENAIKKLGMGITTYEEILRIMSF